MQDERRGAVEQERDIVAKATAWFAAEHEQHVHAGYRLGSAIEADASSAAS